MSAADDSDIFIPSVFVGQTAGQIILNDYTYVDGEFRDHKSNGRERQFAFRLRLCARAQRRFSIQHQHASDYSVLHCCWPLLYRNGESRHELRIFHFNDGGMGENL